MRSRSPKTLRPRSASACAGRLSRPVWTRSPCWWMTPGSRPSTACARAYCGRTRWSWESTRSFRCLRATRPTCCSTRRSSTCSPASLAGMQKAAQRPPSPHCCPATPCAARWRRAVARRARACARWCGGCSSSRRVCPADSTTCASRTAPSTSPPLRTRTVPALRRARPPRRVRARRWTPSRSLSTATRPLTTWPSACSHARRPVPPRRSPKTRWLCSRPRPPIPLSTRPSRARRPRCASCSSFAAWWRPSTARSKMRPHCSITTICCAA